MTTILADNPEMSHESAIKICASLKAKHEDELDRDRALNIKALATAILDIFKKEETRNVDVGEEVVPISMDNFVEEYTLKKTTDKIDEKIKEILGDLDS